MDSRSNEDVSMPRHDSTSRTVLFRFVGRFVFAQPRRPDGTLTVLAVDIGYARDIAAGRHRVAMTAPWGCIHSLGSCGPDLMVMSSASVEPSQDTPERIEQALWFLDGHTVTVGGRNDFRWGGHSATLIAFDRLVPGNAGITPAVTQKPGGPTSAIIRLACGEGIARQMKNELLNLVPLSLANDTSGGETFRLADVVEVSVSTGPSPFVFTICSNQAPAPGSIAVLTQPHVPTVVTISNLCARSSFENFDSEFAALYEVLETPPITRDRLVPKRVEDLNGRIDCHSPVAGSY
jgi:hypothetical protein